MNIQLLHLKIVHTSNGVNSGILCMFSMQRATQPLSEIH